MICNLFYLFSSISLSLRFVTRTKFATFRSFLFQLSVNLFWNFLNWHQTNLFLAQSFQWWETWDFKIGPGWEDKQEQSTFLFSITSLKLQDGFFIMVHVMKRPKKWEAKSIFITIFFPFNWLQAEKMQRLEGCISNFRWTLKIKMDCLGGSKKIFFSTVWKQ